MRKQTKDMTAVEHSESADWCHLCGNRSQETAKVWWPENAEHDPRVEKRSAVKGGRFLRICVGCARAISVAAESKVMNARQVADLVYDMLTQKNPEHKLGFSYVEYGVARERANNIAQALTGVRVLP